jgi:hypothetical protein
MRWLFSRPQRSNALAKRIRDIRINAAYLNNDELVNCLVAMVSDRRFTADQRSRLFLRLGGMVVASSPRPERKVGETGLK